MDANGLVQEGVELLTAEQQPQAPPHFQLALFEGCLLLVNAVNKLRQMHFCAS